MLGFTIYIEWHFSFHAPSKMVKLTGEYSVKAKQPKNNSPYVFKMCNFKTF